MGQFFRFLLYIILAVSCIIATVVVICIYGNTNKWCGSINLQHSFCSIIGLKFSNHFMCCQIYITTSKDDLLIWTDMDIRISHISIDQPYKYYCVCYWPPRPRGNLIYPTEHATTAFMYALIHCPKAPLLKLYMESFNTHTSLKDSPLVYLKVRYVCQKLCDW